MFCFTDGDEKGRDAGADITITDDVAMETGDDDLTKVEARPEEERLDAGDTIVSLGIAESLGVIGGGAYWYPLRYSRTPLIRPPSESQWCGRIRGMVAREGFI